MSENHKPALHSILVFGAAAHIGRPLVEFLGRQAPTIRLRLATSSPENISVLQNTFPKAEIVQADYNDLPSLSAAAADMEGVFVLTPSGTDERPAMTNLVSALKGAGSLKHLIRLVGMQPESNLARIPQSLKEHGRGLPIQHPIAKAILDESSLPVTYLNSGATFMDNFIGMKTGLQSRRTLIWPERLIPYIDTRDIGEVAGRLFLSDNHRHIGQFHTMNNGQDILRFRDVAQIMSETWGVPIAYDASQESFFSAYAAMGQERLQYLWDFFQYERDNEVVWSRNDFVEQMLGRKPRNVRDWLAEYRTAILDN